jgi:toxin ParE1/3/4
VGQARAYGETLAAALLALTAGPTVAGARARSDIGKGMYTLHVSRRGRRGRHFVVFRVGRESDHEVIEVLRLLHDSMDLQRHLPSDDEPG